MELETLFTTSKWGILERLSKGPMSPLQLSRALNTSSANVSQQVRLLEMAGLLVKERQSASGSGKPKTLISLNGNHSYLISVSKDGSRKKLISTDSRKRLMINAWMSKDPDIEQIAFDIAVKFKDSFSRLAGVAWDDHHRLIFMVSDDRECIHDEIESVRESALKYHYHLQSMDRQKFQTIIDDDAKEGEQHISLLIADELLAKRLP